MAKTNKKNGPLAGIRLHLHWNSMKVGRPKAYPGTRTGAKVNVNRANRLYGPEKAFRSYTSEDGVVFIERIK